MICFVVRVVSLEADLVLLSRVVAFRGFVLVYTRKNWELP